VRPFLRVLPLLLACILPTAAKAQQKLEVGYIPVLGVSQLFVIVGEKWDKEAGLELKITRFDSGPVMIQALTGKQLDAYYGGIGPVLVARGNDIDARVVANTAIEEMTVLATGPFAKALKENKSVPAAIAAFTQAQGRKPKFSTQPLGSVPDTTLRYWLQKVSSVELSTVEIVGMGIDKTQQAILAGAVDAATVREPAVTLVREKDPQIQLVALGGQMFPKQPGSVVAVTGEALKEKREALAKLVALHARATELIKKEPERAAKHAHQYLGRGLTDVATIRRALTSPSSQFVADPHDIVESTRIMQDFQLSMGVLKKAVPMEQLFDFSLWAGVKSGK
jgi:NitT/TauT family transport system substrate-binding protein